MAVRIWHSIFAALFATACLAPGAEAQTLRDAIKDGDRELAGRLLDEGADIEKAGVKTPLYLAAERGEEAIVSLLLARGADVNALTRWGSALHIAARRNEAGVVALLLAAGADPNIAGNEFLTRPLHEAAQTGALDAARLLLAHGAEVNVWAQYRSDAPPIHFAAEKGHTEMVALLREHGAAPRAVDPIAPGELARADPLLGTAHLNECQRCHATEPGLKPTGTEPGPNLWNVVGREVGSVEGYAYSNTFGSLDGPWTPERLNRFLADPTGYAPGTNMYVGGEADRETRLALIALFMTLRDEPIAAE